MMRARKIQSPGAWRLPASLRIFRFSSMFWGARARSSFGTISSLPARRSSHTLMYTAFEERSTSTTSLVSAWMEGLDPLGFDEPHHQILQQPHQYLPVDGRKRGVPLRGGKKAPQKS